MEENKGEKLVRRITARKRELLHFELLEIIENKLLGHQ